MGNININGKTAVHAKSDGQLITTDVCLTPPYCVPIAYTNQAESKMADNTASSVKVEGNPVCNQTSNFKISKGDAPGSCAGVMSGSIGQMAEFITFSNDVMIEGKPAVRNGDKMVSNMKNTGPQPLNQPPAGDADAGTAKEPVATKGEFSQQFDFSNLIGHAPGETNILERPVYEIWTKQGQFLCTGNLSSKGLTSRVFTPEKTDVIVWLGDGEWRIFGDADHGPYEEGDEQRFKTATSQLVFHNFAWAHLTELDYKLVAGGQEITGKTDGNGAAQTLKDLKPGTEVEVWVQKEATKEYKNIGTVTAHAGETNYSIVSPKIKAEASTEKDQKGNAAAPPKAATKPADTKDTPPQNVATEGTCNADGQPLAKPAQNMLQEPVMVDGSMYVLNFYTWDFFGDLRRPGGNSKLNPCTPPSQAGMGTPASKENFDKLQKFTEYAETQVRFNLKAFMAKNNNGYLPALLKIAEYERKHRIDPKSHEVPDFGLGKANAKSPTGFNERCLAYVKTALMHTHMIEGLLEAQQKSKLAGLAKDSGRDWVNYGYTKVEDPKLLPTVAITYWDAYSEGDAVKVKETFRLEDEVKGLKKEIPALEAAIRKSEAEIERLNGALKKATGKKEHNELNRQLSHEKGNCAHKKGELERKQKRLPEAEKELDKAKKDAPQKQKTATYPQPDLMYTLPGDLILYELVDPIKEANHPGHIDIRTYHSFCADFASQWPVPQLGIYPFDGNGKKKHTPGRFRVRGVYRKISDTMAMARVHAFLRIIREYAAGETLLKNPDESYAALKYDKDNKAKPFVTLGKEDLTSSLHPFHPKHPSLDAHLHLLSEHTDPSPLSPPSDQHHALHGKHPLHKKAPPLKTNLIPAGAYQITYHVWKDAIDRTGWPDNFGKDMQERVAMYLLQSTPNPMVDDRLYPRRSALGYIMEGHVDKAVDEAKLKNLYAFLPGGAKQQLNEDELEAKFKKYLLEEQVKQPSSKTGTVT